MTLLGDEFRIDGEQLDPDVTERVQRARLFGGMKGTMGLELTIWDGDGELMLNGKLATARRPRKTQFGDASWMQLGKMRLIFDGILFRLAGVRKSGPLVTLTFNDEVASLSRGHTRAIKTSRGDVTRAQTIGLAFAAVKEIAIPFRCPEERIAQNIEKPDDAAEAKGLSSGDRLTVKGVAIDSAQRKNMETVLAVADRLRAGERATLALLVACIQESTMRNLTGGDADSSGILQVRASTAIGITPRTVIDPRSGLTHGAVQRDDTGPIAPGTLNPRDVKEVARVFLLRGFGRGGAIQTASKNPDMKIGDIAQTVQISDYPDSYEQWTKEAQTILDAWGGVGQVRTLRESFEFQIGGKLDTDDGADPESSKDENYWAGTNRLGNELDGWNLWAWRNQANFVSDEWLFKRKPVFTIGRADLYARYRTSDQHKLAPFVELDYEVDVGSKVNEITLTSASRRWDGAPGSTVQMVELGAMSGKWLISQVDFDLQRDIGIFTLRRPIVKAPEPAPNTTTHVVTETRRQESGSPRARILTIARRSVKESARFTYDMVRPYPSNLFQGTLPSGTLGPVERLHIDCSSFVTLVYKSAQVPDPNGSDYNGSGNTSTLRANGTKTSDPQPGDLAHYGSGAVGGASHVMVYVGGGKAIGMQVSGCYEAPVTGVGAVRSDFAGYWKYDLEGSP